MERDFKAYHESIGKELQASQDRIRNLIGDAHWGEDGRHKEAILRKVLRSHLPESLHIGTGFVSGPTWTSHQTDILITRRDMPTLFKDGEMMIVTPDAVVAIIEVKTCLRAATDASEAVEKLAEDIAHIRQDGNRNCHAGLFAFDRSQRDPDKMLLELLNRASLGDSARVVNWLAYGPDCFVRFWGDASEVQGAVNGPVWHTYFLRGLAHAYFLSNVTWESTQQHNSENSFAWFPIEGSKETHRKWYIALDGDEAIQFGQG